MNYRKKLICSLLALTLVLGLIFSASPALPTNATTGEPAIPTFTDGTATYGSTAHDAGPTPDGGINYQKTYSGVTAAEVQAYEQKLRAAGFTLYDEREIKNGSNTNRFATYVNNAAVMVHINYFPALSKNQFQIIYGSAKYLIPTTPAGSYEAVVTPSVSIIERTDGVLCMVVQLADGSYVVIDGGYGFSMTSDYTIPAKTYHRDGSGITYTYRRDHKKDMATLLAFLQDTNRDGAINNKDVRPQVTWMITHGDPDHVQLPYVFMQTYQSQFDLNAVVYNFPNFANIGLNSNYNVADLTKKTQTGFISYTKNYFPQAKHYIYHTGQIMNLPGCQIEFLYTQEDHYPNKMTSPNHTCGIWRFNFDGGKSFLVTGDAEVETNKQAAKVLGSYLQSDMMQVIHHGSNGGTTDFYNVVDPDVCFWPCLDTSFYHDLRHLGTYSGYRFNAVLRNGKRTHYTTSATNVVYVPTLRYDANGGAGEMALSGTMYSSNTASEGTSPNGAMTVSANGFTAPSGYAFVGWSTTADGAVQYMPGDTITVKTNTVLYAVYSPAAPTEPTVGPTEVPTQTPTEKPTEAPTEVPAESLATEPITVPTTLPSEEVTTGKTMETVPNADPEETSPEWFLPIGILLVAGIVTTVILLKRKKI